jgi:glyoxylase-like metal-dependent hydrolase (beta-lactamase superfamily II)
MAFSSTRGHSDDSVTVAVDGLGAFVGDLRPAHACAGPATVQAEMSWRKVRAAGVRRVFFADGAAFDLVA